MTSFTPVIPSSRRGPSPGRSQPEARSLQWPPLAETRARKIQPIRVVMAFKIRDEGDVLEHNLRFHHALGVDHFIVTDNGSTDETVDILARYTEGRPADRDRGSRHRLPRAGSAVDDGHGAAGGHRARRGLGRPHRRRRVLVADRGLAEGDPRRGRRALRRPGRAALRVHRQARRPGLVRRATDHPRGPGALPAQGRAPRRPGRGDAGPGPARRRGARALGRRGRDDPAAGPAGSPRDPQQGAGRERRGRRRTLRLVWAPWWPVRILHFPVRSSAQFRRRTQIAIFEGMFPDRGRFRRLREHYEAGSLRGALRRADLRPVRGRRGAARRDGWSSTSGSPACWPGAPTRSRAGRRAPCGSSPRPRSSSATAPSSSSTPCTLWPAPAAG